jgi:hypothetical protein
MSEDDRGMILDAIHTLRKDLSDRMDRQDQERKDQWKAIADLAKKSCPEQRHTDIEMRVRDLETARAKMAGVVIAITVTVSGLAWLVERIMGAK